MIIRGGLLALHGRDDFTRADLRVSGERIQAIAPSIAPTEGEETIDACGLQVFPGAIDPHVHFDEPGFTYREDFLHGTSAAASGGVTTVIDMPCTSLPPVTDKASLENKLSQIAKSAVVDFGLFGGVPGGFLGVPADASTSGASSAAGEAAFDGDKALRTRMEALAPFVLGFKCYFVSGMATFPAVNHYEFAKLVAACAAVDRPVLVHAEDRDYVENAERELRATRDDWNAYVDSRPEVAETLAVAAAAALAGDYARFVHIVHVASSNAARIARERGMTAETCPHYLAFSREDFTALGAALKTAPPVKSPGEAEKLMRMLETGDIAFAASDHAPARPEEKAAGSVWTAYGGIPGTGTMVPFLLSRGLYANRIGLPSYLRATSEGAAARYGLSNRKGSIAVGNDADFYMVDPEGATMVNGMKLFSKGTVTPFEGMRFKGRIASTWVRGKRVFDGVAVSVDAGFGRFLTWGHA